MVCFLPVSCPLLSLSVGPAGRDPPIRPLRGPAFRLKADEGLQPKICEDCVPLKASCRLWAGREALGSPLLRPLPSGAPLTPGETDKPAEGQTQSHASRAAPSPPPSLLPKNQVSLQAQPTNHPPPHLPPPPLPLLLPKSPRRNGRELRGTRAWLQHFGNERNCRRAPESTEFSRSFCVQ